LRLGPELVSVPELGRCLSCPKLEAPASLSGGVVDRGRNLSMSFSSESDFTILEECRIFLRTRWNLFRGFRFEGWWDLKWEDFQGNGAGLVRESSRSSWKEALPLCGQ
jgi:hypothetical protein